MMKSLICLGLICCSAAAGGADDITAAYRTWPKALFLQPDPMAATWNEVRATTIPLLPQNIATPGRLETSISSLRVKAVHNRRWLALLLEWKDAALHVQVSTDRSSDACAVQFALKDPQQTSPFMGNKDFPVVIQHWKGIWQHDVEQGYQRVIDLYPNTWVDTYRFGRSIAIEARNPVAQPKRSLPVEELFAEGYGTLTTQPHQDLRGWGHWQDGRWRVVLVRPLRSGDAHDPVLDPGTTTAVAFALWEGGAQDVGGRKNYAVWTPLHLE